MKPYERNLEFCGAAKRLLHSIYLTSAL